MKVGANIIAMYPSTTLFIAIGQLAIVILVLFSYPMQIHPCRNCLNDIISGKTSGKVNPAVDEDCNEGDDLDHGSAPVSTLRHTVLTTLLIATGFTIAFFLDDLQMG